VSEFDETGGEVVGEYRRVIAEQGDLAVFLGALSAT